MGCVTDQELMTRIMQGIDVVMHFAGLKAVGESTVKPLEYYRVNVGGTVNLLRVSIVSLSPVQNGFIVHASSRVQKNHFQQLSHSLQTSQNS